MSDGAPLTIVMYHYVRPLEATRYPEIKGLRVSEFDAQLAHLRAHHELVSVADVVEHSRGGARLPANAALLTFDDGYADHYQHVFPRLHEAGVPGAFFAPVGPIARGELLDVNRIHFVLAACHDTGALCDAIDRAVLERGPDLGLLTPAAYRAKWAQPNRFDTAEVIYVKRMLQVGLPRDLRTEIARSLFAQHVSADERAFAGELYMTREQLALMQRCGMYVGSHGDTHQWLDALTREEQVREIRASIDFLRSLGSPVDDHWVMCYPYGGWNEELLTELRSLGCTLGVTTEPRVASLGVDDPLLLPRFDTNDFPKS